MKHDKLENDKKEPEMTFKQMCISLFMVFLVFATIISMSFDDQYYYRAYQLNEQYIGNITIDDGDYQTTYYNVLIFDVQPLKDIYGNIDIPQPEYKYGYHAKYNLGGDNLASFILCGEPHQLYFAGEHKLNNGLTNDSVIVARWKKSMVGDDHISGVQEIQQCGWLWYK